MGQILFSAGAGVFDDPGEREIGVFGSLREATGEIVEAAREPRVVFAQTIHTEDDQLFREKFGEGGSHRLEVRARGYEVNVRLDGETRRRENAVAAECVFAG